MSVSFYSIAQMQQPQVITWYNPQDPSQTVTMTLLFTVGGSEFDWTQDYIVVTDQNGGQVLSNNVFPYSSLNQIETELNPALGSSTNFESYWFGGGAWQAEGYFTEPSMGGPVNYGPASSYGIPSNLARRADGSMSPVFPIPPIPNGMGSLPFPGSFPAGDAVLGSVTFGIVQSQPPYWHVPLTKIEDITVYPTTYGEYKTGEDTTHSTSPLTVTLWKTDQSQKALIIPFTVGVLKTAGSKLGSLVTDYPGAVLQHSAQGDYYSMSVSFYSVAQMQQPQVITWYNPQDPTQTVTMTLLFTVGGSEFDWTQDYCVVTEQNGGQVLSLTTSFHTHL